MLVSLFEERSRATNLTREEKVEGVSHSLVTWFLDTFSTSRCSKPLKRPGGTTLRELF